MTVGRRPGLSEVAGFRSVPIWRHSTQVSLRSEIGRGCANGIGRGSRGGSGVPVQGAFASGEDFPRVERAEVWAAKVRAQQRAARRKSLYMVRNCRDRA